jgi:polysaccharide deacetylase 2 family uncharacterized protein YibQ
LAKKKHGRSLSKSRLARLFLLLVTLLALAGLFYLLRDRLGEGGEGVFPSVERRLSPEERLTEFVLLGAREMGVPRHRIARRPAADGGHRFEFRCPDRLHPITANRWLHRIFVDAGVEVLECVEEGRSQRPTLRYRLAAGDKGQARATLVVLPPLGDPPLQEAWPRLAILLDDLGHHFGRVQRDLFELDMKLTASILPGRRSSGRLAREARKRGHAVFMHLPMEPLGYPEHDPGYGALFADMSPDSVRRHMNVLAADFGPMDGFNNHMGSRASQVDSVVTALVDWAAARELIVVDSYTTAHSLIHPLGRERGARVLRVDLFLDGEMEDEGQIAENIAQAVDKARQRGWALAIAHPRPETLRALRKMVPRLRDYGLRFVTVPELMGGSGEDDPAPPSP